MKRRSIPDPNKIGLITDGRQLSDMEESARAALHTIAQANAVLSNPFFIEVLDEMEKKLVSVWSESKEDERDKRERAHISLQVLRDIRREFKVLAGGEKSARKAVEDIMNKRRQQSERMN